MKQFSSPKLFFLLLTGVAVTLPIGFKVNNYFVGGLVAVWLFSPASVEFIKNKGKYKEFLLAVGIYFIFLFSVLYSANVSQGVKDMEYKLGLFLFPLVLLTSRRVSAEEATRILFSFAYSCLAVSMYMILAAFVYFLKTKDSSWLFYHALAGQADMHAVYFSAYLLLSVFILLHYLLHESGWSYFRKTLHVVGLVVFTGTLVLLTSKTMLGVFVLLLFLYTFYLLHKKRKVILGIGLAAGLSFAVLLAAMFVPYVKNRTLAIVDSNFAVLNQEKFVYNTEFSGLTLRLLFWKYAITIIDQKDAWLFGVGTGDSQDLLNDKYLEHNLYSGYGLGTKDSGYLNYDTHSQFVETFLKIGLFGLFFLLFYLSRCLLIAYRRQSILYLVFLVVFVSFSFTDTTLQSNKGVIFFAFFNSLFLSFLTEKPDAESRVATSV